MKMIARMFTLIVAKYLKISIVNKTYTKKLVMLQGDNMLERHIEINVVCVRNNITATIPAQMGSCPNDQRHLNGTRKLLLVKKHQPIVSMKKKACGSNEVNDERK
jgi:hypothetical protein